MNIHLATSSALLIISVTNQPAEEEKQFEEAAQKETAPEHESVELERPPKIGFLSATYKELKLVVWPSRQQLFSESIAVILMVTLSAASIAAISRFYGWGASQIFR